MHQNYGGIDNSYNGFVVGSIVELLACRLVFNPLETSKSTLSIIPITYFFKPVYVRTLDLMLLEWYLNEVSWSVQSQRRTS